MCASMRAVVVLPFVPVTAAMGMRARAARREEHVEHRTRHVAGLAARRCHVHAEPGRGIHLADGAAHVLVALGNVRAQEVHAADVEADGADGADRHLDVVRVHDVGHVLGRATGRKVGRGPEVDDLARGGHGVPVESLLRKKALGLVVEVDARQDLLVADATARIAVHLVHQLRHRVHAVAHDVPGHPPGHRDQLAVHHQHPVVVADDELLDDDAAADLPAPRGTPARTCSAFIRLMETPRPWLPL